MLVKLENLALRGMIWTESRRKERDQRGMTTETVILIGVLIGVAMAAGLAITTFIEDEIGGWG